MCQICGIFIIAAIATNKHYKFEEEKMSCNSYQIHILNHFSHNAVFIVNIILLSFQPIGNGYFNVVNETEELRRSMINRLIRLNYSNERICELVTLKYNDVPVPFDNVNDIIMGNHVSII